MKTDICSHKQPDRGTKKREKLSLTFDCFNSHKHSQDIHLLRASRLYASDVEFIWTTGELKITG